MNVPSVSKGPGKVSPEKLYRKAPGIFFSDFAVVREGGFP
jgi:hypothetical protein